MNSEYWIRCRCLPLIPQLQFLPTNMGYGLHAFVLLQFMLVISSGFTEILVSLSFSKCPVRSNNWSEVWTGNQWKRGGNEAGEGVPFFNKTRLVCWVTWGST